MIASSVVNVVTNKVSWSFTRPSPREPAPPARPGVPISKAETSSRLRRSRRRSSDCSFVPASMPAPPCAARLRRAGQSCASLQYVLDAIRATGCGPRPHVRRRNRTAQWKRTLCANQQPLPKDGGGGGNLSDDIAPAITSAWALVSYLTSLRSDTRPFELT